MEENASSAAKTVMEGSLRLSNLIIEMLGALILTFRSMISVSQEAIPDEFSALSEAGHKALLKLGELAQEINERTKCT